MKRIAYGAAFLLVLCLGVRAEERVAVPQTVGTPRTLSAEESVKVEAFLRRTNSHISAKFGDQMGFGLTRMEPLMYFHFISDSGPRWINVELLGVLVHADPVVYKNPLPTAKGADALRNESFAGRPKKVTPPTEDQFKQAETRPLLPAETVALKALNAGKDFYWEQIGTEIRAVGALRADKSCAECHGVKEKTLLGALTFRWDTQLVLKSIQEEEARKLKQDAKTK